MTMTTTIKINGLTFVRWTFPHWQPNTYVPSLFFSVKYICLPQKYHNLSFKREKKLCFLSFVNQISIFKDFEHIQSQSDNELEVGPIGTHIISAKEAGFHMVKISRNAYFGYFLIKSRTFGKCSYKILFCMKRHIGHAFFGAFIRRCYIFWENNESLLTQIPWEMHD